MPFPKTTQELEIDLFTSVAGVFVDLLILEALKNNACFCGWVDGNCGISNFVL